MRYKELVSRKLEQLQNALNVQSSLISQLRPPQELKENLDKIKEKIQEIQVLVNTEHSDFPNQ